MKKESALRERRMKKKGLWSEVGWEERDKTVIGNRRFKRDGRKGMNENETKGKFRKRYFSRKRHKMLNGEFRRKGGKE